MITSSYNDKILTSDVNYINMYTREISSQNIKYFKSYSKKHQGEWLHPSLNARRVKLTKELSAIIPRYILLCMFEKKIMNIENKLFQAKSFLDLEVWKY